MAAEAQAQRELLVRQGLADAVLDGLVQPLDRFDTALEEGAGGRRAAGRGGAARGVTARRTGSAMEPSRLRTKKT